MGEGERRLMEVPIRNFRINTGTSGTMRMNSAIIKSLPSPPSLALHSLHFRPKGTPETTILHFPAR